MYRAWFYGNRRVKSITGIGCNEIILFFCHHLNII